MRSRRRVQLVVLALAGLLAVSGCMPFPDDPPPVSYSKFGGGASGTVWDPGNIFSDQVFYDGTTMGNEQAVQDALDAVGGGCTASTCLRSARYDIPDWTVGWCSPVSAQSGVSFAKVLLVLGQACGFNPKVAIIMIQKESQGLTKDVPPAALTGFGCPDSGPGGSANCDAAVAGVWAQTSGLFASAARGRQDASIIHYPEGQTSDILWNVAETGCGSGPVAVQNRATAWIYTYTPYQPNAASLAAYPGEGDACSSYGNRNLFELYKQYFGTTGGGRASTGTGGTVNIGPGGLAQNGSQDPSSFGWVHAGPMEPLVWQGHNFGQVASGTAPLWTAMLNELVPQIPGGLTGDLGCFEDRANVNSPGQLSFHAYGLACDINSGNNSNGSDPHLLSGPYVIPVQAAETLAAKYGMEWGGDWGFPDPMHFEIHLTPDQVRSVISQ